MNSQFFITNSEINENSEMFRIRFKQLKIKYLIPDLFNQ